MCITFMNQSLARQALTMEGGKDVIIKNVFCSAHLFKMCFNTCRTLMHVNSLHHKDFCLFYCGLTYQQPDILACQRK